MTMPIVVAKARMSRYRTVSSVACLAMSLFHAIPASAEEVSYEFTDADRQFLSRFSIDVLSPPPPAPSNAVADDARAAHLGHRLFFDPRLSANGRVSCASCHQPGKYFTDGLSTSKGLGTTRRSAPSIIAAAYSPWSFWDGRKDSLWSQALSPLEDVVEQGLSRTQLALLIATHYRAEYEPIFGPLPAFARWQEYPIPASPLGGPAAKRNWESLTQEDRNAINRVFTDIGKSLMAYQRHLRLLPARFDQFLAMLNEETIPHERLRESFAPDEVQGLRIFMGKGNCASCHNGPLFTNFEFHNVGAPEPDRTNVDLGRHAAIPLLLNDEFTCLSEWSDANFEDCEEMRFLKRQGPELVGAYKTPSLRNVAATAPYMQSGQLLTLGDVVAHYNKPSPPFYDREQHPSRPHFDILPLRLSDAEVAQLIAFLGTLTSPIPTDDPWWQRPKP